MNRPAHRNHSGIQGEGALGSDRGREDAFSELMKQFDMHANQVTPRKIQLREGAVGVFGGEAKANPAAKENGIAISMDAKGHSRDNVFFKSIWNSIRTHTLQLARPDRRSAGTWCLTSPSVPTPA